MSTSTTRTQDALLHELILYERRCCAAENQCMILHNKMAELQIRKDRALIAQQKSQCQSLSIQLDTYDLVEQMYSIYSTRMVEKMYEIHELIRFEDEQQEQQEQEDTEDRASIAAQQ